MKKPNFLHTVFLGLAFVLFLHSCSSNPITQKANNAPYIPSNPNPLDSATDVSMTPTLTWNGGDPDAGDTTKYDLYFDIVNPPEVLKSSNQLLSSFTFTTQLDSNRTYYWRINAKDIKGAVSTGPIWRFTMANQSGNIFFDGFDNPNLTENWIFYGYPSPVWVSSIFGKNGIFDNNGDPNPYSGAYSKQLINTSSGLTIEAEVYLEVSNIDGCWVEPSIGITKDANPSNSNGYRGAFLSFAFEGGMCWMTPPALQGHSYFRIEIFAEDNTILSYPLSTLNADIYNNGWHILKIMIQSDRYVKFYADNNLLWTTTKKIHPSVLSGRNIILGGCSSGIAGKAYHNWIKVTY